MKRDKIVEVAEEDLKIVTNLRNNMKLIDVNLQKCDYDGKLNNKTKSIIPGIDPKRFFVLRRNMTKYVEQKIMRNWFHD